MFQALRDRPIRLLEIGIGGYGAAFSGGASLRMWAEYFHNSRVVGIDIVPKRLDVSPQIALLQGSQDDAIFLQKVWQEHGPFDIVIDDGSHVASHVLAAFSAIYPLMRAGGIYAIEDVQTAFWPGFYGGVADGRGTIVSTTQAAIVDIHRLEIEAGGGVKPTPSFGDITSGIHVHRNLIFFDRGSNTFPSNLAYSCSSPSI